jgi:hypothetical protein
MSKVEKFKDRARSFRALLVVHAPKDTDAESLLQWLTPLFEEIAAGKVQPPQRYEYRLALGKDNPFYEPTSPFSEAKAQFISALEDWESQAWYQGSIKRAKDNNAE